MRAHVRRRTSSLSKRYRCVQVMLETHAGFYDKRTVTGRKLPQRPAQGELRRRARELVKLRQQQTVQPEVAAKRAEAVVSAAPNFVDFFSGNRSCASAAPILCLRASADSTKQLRGCYRLQRASACDWIGLRPNKRRWEGRHFAPPMHQA